MHVVNNHLSTTILIGSMSFLVYFLPVKNLGERFDFLSTLFLTSVAFKYVTLEMMPQIPYLTMIDWVTYGCMIMQAAMLLGVSLSSSLISNNHIIFNCLEEELLGRICRFTVGLFIYVAAQYTMLNAKRQKYFKDCKNTSRASSEGARCKS